MKNIRAILVHGTFARETDWDDCAEEGKPDSTFTNHLRQGLAGKGVRLTAEPFHWSGTNSHPARRDAARGLRTRIAKLRDDPAGEDGLFLIGHSHGGTVARLAANLAGTDGQIRGVVTFGAPFVRFEPRPLGLLTQGLLWIFRLGVLLLAVLLALPLLALWVFQAVTPSGLWEVYQSIELWFFDQMEHLDQVKERLIAEFDPPAEVEVDHLNYHARFDEAGMLLRFWSLPTWIVNTMFASLIWSGAAAVALFVIGLLADTVTGFEFLEPVRAWLYSPAIPEALSSISGADLPDDATDDFWNFSFALGGMTLLVALGLTVSVIPICILALWALRKSWFSFGGEDASWTLATRISVDRLGSNRAEIRRVVLPAALAKGAMQHNWYYNDPKIVDELVERLADWKITPSARLNIERRVFALLSIVAQIAVFLLVLILALRWGF